MWYRIIEITNWVWLRNTTHWRVWPQLFTPHSVPRTLSQFHRTGLLTALQSEAFHCPQGVTEHSSFATGLGRLAQALSSATEPSSSRQLTYLIRMPFPQVAEHWVLEWNNTDLQCEAAAACSPQLCRKMAASPPPSHFSQPVPYRSPGPKSPLGPWHAVWVSPGLWGHWGRMTRWQLTVLEVNREDGYSSQLPFKGPQSISRQKYNAREPRSVHLYKSHDTSQPWFP